MQHLKDLLEEKREELPPYEIDACKGVFKGGGGSNPPPSPKFSDFFLKSEGKEIERKKNEKGWGGGAVNC